MIFFSFCIVLIFTLADASPSRPRPLADDLYNSLIENFDVKLGKKYSAMEKRRWRIVASKKYAKEKRINPLNNNEEFRIVFMKYHLYRHFIVHRSVPSFLICIPPILLTS